MASSLISIASFPRPRSLSATARRNSPSICSVDSACSTYTRVRESSGAITSNEGFSVVAPIKVMFPASTCGRNASCCALLKRCTSSTKTMVRLPACRVRSAAAITSLISLIPVSTALNAINSDCVIRAISRASVVLPHPGGPHKIIEPISSRSICVRSGFPGPSNASCPVNSSSVRGRIRSASGCEAAPRPSSGSSFAKRLIENICGSRLYYLRKSRFDRVLVAQALLPVRFLLLVHGFTASSGCATQRFPQTV